MNSGQLQQWFISNLKERYDERELRNMFFMTLESLFSISRVDFFKQSSREFTAAELARARRLIKRLKACEPIQYILGRVHFLDLEFLVSPAVLIPRPETEELVGLIIEQYKEVSRPLRILDIGTGSGCIACSLAHYLKQANCLAADVSPAALAVAAKNAANLGAMVHFLEWDVLQEEIPLAAGSFDLIVSNPPYVRESEKAMMKPHVLFHEPGLALFVPDDDPLLFYRAISRLGTYLLKEKGRLYLEINEAFAPEVADILEQSGFMQVRIWNDIHGRNRIVEAWK